MAYQGQKTQGKKSTGYDKTKDIQLFKADAEVGNNKYEVTVFSYDGGTPKVQISRLAKNAETGEFSYVPKLGRLTKEEIKELSGLLKQAYGNMDSDI